MRIAELAELTGVTVRTIRYYHQVGVLSEPPRRSNGYRNYTVDHLVAVLKITQLTGSGLSLAQAGLVASESSDSSEEMLDEVDRVLDSQIAALTEQRERLARARAGGHVGLSRMAAALSLSSADVPIAILLAHLYRDHPQVEQFADALHEPELRSALMSVQEQFDALDETSSDNDLEQLALRVQVLIAEFADDLPPLTLEQSQLILTLVERDLNVRQVAFLLGQD